MTVTGRVPCARGRATRSRRPVFPAHLPLRVVALSSPTGTASAFDPGYGIGRSTNARSARRPVDPHHRPWRIWRCSVEGGTASTAQPAWARQ